MVKLSKCGLLVLSFSLMISIAQADYYDDAMTAWQKFKTQSSKGQKPDILDFLDKQDNPHIIAATTATGLDVGINKTPSVERVNRLLGILARKLKTAVESVQDLADQKQYVKSVKDHQLEHFRNIWQRLQDKGDFSKKITPTDIKQGANNILIAASGDILITANASLHKTKKEIIESDLQGFVWEDSFNPALYRSIYGQFPWLDRFTYKSNQHNNVSQDIPLILRNIGDFSGITLDFRNKSLPASQVNTNTLPIIQTDTLAIWGDADLRQILSPQSHIKTLTLMNRKKAITPEEINLLRQIQDLNAIITDDQTAKDKVGNDPFAKRWKFKK